MARPAVKSRVGTAKTYSVTQAATLLGIDVRTIYRAIKKGEIPSVKAGKRILVPKRWVDSRIGNGG